MSALPRLCDAGFAPRYDRAAMTAGVVHLGLGAFHRAHQAPVFDALAAGGDLRWGVTGVAMRSPGVVAALAAQDGLYSLSQRGGDEAAPRVIGVLKALLVAAQDPEAVIAALADPDTHLVTLTITEKGYLDHGPASAAGLIARGLERRRGLGLAPLTILSCDNRAHNGAVARDAVLAAAQGAGIGDAGLRWIAEQAAFPATMVDRITPAATPAMIAESSALLGREDAAAVWTEPFWQWVIEDRFAAARPDFASAGVQLVADVAPWEAAKLRLLNAAHSTLAYHGLLRGHRFVHEAIADAQLAALIEQVWDEAAVTIDAAVVDVAAYRAALRRRFANPALPHALIQIAADGSQKLPPRLLATLGERSDRGLASPALAAAVAGWVVALGRIDGLADPLLAELQPIARGTESPSAILARIAPDFHAETEIDTALAALRETA
ncbi:mannitol dehydrogenase family protein [Sphingomonas immobilis]|uniref:Mannitol dehydrogenase family protein n=1 Tax=Sphingomonas immobilis TaxID=3063997 RepID=A0ABT9A106_9SPHN|nr:mannitol dehydrogenase family protein [Sphingomonas sp. CA1-15]MDO7843511.1 mannitol dehydrogenase family protein [Sphingomonas sp. CA1-15]